MRGPFALLLLALSLGCVGPGRAVRRAVARGDLDGALRAYQQLVDARSEGDPDLLAEVAFATLRRYASSDDPAERNAGFSALRSLGARSLDVLESLSRAPGVVGDRAAAMRWDLDGREGDPPARLREAMQSGDRERRLAAMVPLRPPTATRRLRRLLRDADPAIRAAAALRLASARSSGVTARLMTLLREDPDGDVRAACVSALGGRGPEALDALTAALQDRETFVRMAVPSALVSSSLEEARVRLAPILAGPRSALSIEAARALAMRGDDDARRYLVAALRSPRAEQRAQAAVASHTLVAAHADALADALDGGDPEVVLRVAAALAREGAHRDRALAALRTLARSPDGFVAVRALQLLAGRDEPGVLEPLRQALSSPDAGVRRVAALAWSDAVDASGECDPLAPLLRDPDRSVATLAALSIIVVAAR